MYGRSGGPPNWGGVGFSILPHAAYSCYDPCPVQHPIETLPYSPYPFSTFWKRARELDRSGAFRGGEDINACLPPYIEGNCRFWWVFRAWGRDAIVANPRAGGGSGDPEFPAFGTTPRSTMLKMELIYVDGIADQIRFACDIGSGVVGTVGPAKRVQGYILVPDVERFEAEGGPAGPYPTDALVARSEIHPAVMLAQPQGFPGLTYTQPLALTVAVPTWTFPIPALARRVRVVSDGAATVEFLLPATVGAPAVGTLAVTAGAEASAEVPRTATDVRVTASAPPTTLTLVFELEL